MNVYFYASAFTTLLLQDKSWQAVEHWIMTRQPAPALSDFGWGEYNSAVAMRVRARQSSADQGKAAIGAGRELLAGWRFIETLAEDIREATALVARFDLRLRLPDAIHVATARRLRCPLVTGDYVQADATSTLGIEVYDLSKGFA